MSSRSRAHWLAKLTRAPAYRWHDAGSWLARIRRWCLHTILRHDGESCDACGRAVPGAWWVEDRDAWRSSYARAVGHGPERSDTAEPDGGLLCPNCFVAAASSIGACCVATIGVGPGDAIIDARIVFSGSAPDLTFVDIEDREGRSICVGEWQGTSLLVRLVGR